MMMRDTFRPHITIYIYTYIGTVAFTKSPTIFNPFHFTRCRTRGLRWQAHVMQTDNRSAFDTNKHIFYKTHMNDMALVRIYVLVVICLGQAP